MPTISPPPLKRRRLDTPERESKPQLHGNSESIRIFSWNVNGIAPFVQPTITSFFTSEPKDDSIPSDPAPPASSLRDLLRRHSWPEVLFLQEVKINPDDSATIAAVRQAVKKRPNDPADAHDYEAHFCLPSDKHNARGFGRKVYGVCSVVRSDFKQHHVERIRPVEWDKEGRFLIIETKAGPDRPKLALVNVYAVNGTDHDYRDPETGRVVGTRHDRKLQVHSLLQKECRDLEAEGFAVVVAGDVNIARASIDGFPNLRTFPKQHCVNRADFEAKFFSSPSTPVARTKTTKNLEGPSNDKVTDADGLDMIDTFRHLHPSKKGYTYYPRSCRFGESCDRVDMILISRSLQDSLVEAGMHETPGERGPSDHVPLYAGLFFGSSSSADLAKLQADT